VAGVQVNIAVRDGEFHCDGDFHPDGTLARCATCSPCKPRA